MIKIFDKQHNEIPWEVNRFPDGQNQFKILSKNKEKIDYILASIPNPESLDLFLQAIHTIAPNNLSLGVRINYLYGARSDKNIAGDYSVCNVAKYMIEQLDYIAVQYDLNIEILAPHCQWDRGYNTRIIPVEEFNKNEVHFKELNTDVFAQYDLVVYPDESAQRRFKSLNVKSIVCEKHRDQETGNIVSHVIPELEEDVKKIILCDDLADGGRSFLAIADTLKENVKADLFIFHGVFSNNALPRLLQKFNRVFVTNSLEAVQTQYDLLPEDMKKRATILDVWKCDDPG